MDPLNPQENPINPRPEPVPVPPPAPQSGASSNVDLGKILLPKKETPGQTPLSAERVNAGELFKQEQAAAAEGTKAQEPQQAPAAPKPAPMPKPDEDIVKPIETYQRDIESVVQDKNVSVLSIASAEADRRAKDGSAPEETSGEKRRSTLMNVVLIGGGFLLLVVSSGALAYLVSRPTSVPITQNGSAQAPFITVDGTKVVTITADESRDTIMANLNAARQASSLSLGLVEQIAVTESSSTSSGDTITALSAPAFFSLIAPNVPSELVGALEPTFLLGVHIYNGNQAFIIAKVYSYEQAYAGMLAWEGFMHDDLSPLFDYIPTQQINQGSTPALASSTPNVFSDSKFADKILENQDTRVLVNDNGQVYFLWSFIDRNTLVIATNDATLREVISRLKNAPVTPIPGQ